MTALDKLAVAGLTLLYWLLLLTVVGTGGLASTPVYVGALVVGAVLAYLTVRGRRRRRATPR